MKTPDELARVIDAGIFSSDAEKIREAVAALAELQTQASDLARVDAWTRFRCWLLGHDWERATWDALGTCRRCDLDERRLLLP